MEEKTHLSGQPDYHHYDQLWQRVAPDLTPYPDYRAPGEVPVTVLPANPVQPQPDPVPPTPPIPPQPPVQPPVMPQPPMPMPPVPVPPGAIQNPCCMGSEALELLQVLTGFIEEELIDQRTFKALACKAPSWAKAGLKELAEDAGAHARELLSACYMITGQCYRPMGTTGQVYIGGWCPALRERYHTEACGALNYARAAESTPDPCLRRILERLSRDEYHHADVLLEMLQKSMRC